MKKRNRTTDEAWLFFGEIFRPIEFSYPNMPGGFQRVVAWLSAEYICTQPASKVDCE